MNRAIDSPIPSEAENSQTARKKTLQDYLGHPPAINWHGTLTSLSTWKKVLARLAYLLAVPYLPRTEEPQPPTSLPKPQAGYQSIDLAFTLISQQAEEASNRREKLEAKAERVLAILFFLVPLIGSLIMFLLQTSGVSSFRITTGVLLVAITLFLLSGFVAAFRAGSVKNWQSLGIGTYFDCEDSKWKDISREYCARGMAYCSAYNEAMNDLVADFVRSARLHVFLAVLTLAVGTACLSLVVEPSRSQGQQKASESIEALARSIDALTTTIRSTGALPKATVAPALPAKPGLGAAATDSAPSSNEPPPIK